MKEITREDAKNLKVGTEYVVFNPLTNQLKIEIASPVDIVHNKHCFDRLRFFVMNEE